MHQHRESGCEALGSRARGIQSLSTQHAMNPALSCAVRNHAGREEHRLTGSDADAAVLRGNPAGLTRSHGCIRTQGDSAGLGHAR